MFCGHHSLGEGGYTAQQTSVYSVHSVVKNDSAADLHPCSHRLRRLLPSVVGGYADENCLSLRDHGGAVVVV